MAEGEFRVRVKYCGGCNPEIDRGRLVERVKEFSRSEGDPIAFVGYAEKGDLILLVNGCPRACLEEDNPEWGEAPDLVSVQGARVDLEAVPEEGLPRVVWQKIRARCDQRSCSAIDGVARRG